MTRGCDLTPDYGRGVLERVIPTLSHQSSVEAETAARCINGARFVSIPQATHWMQHDHAEAFNDAALAFLALNGK